MSKGLDKLLLNDCFDKTLQLGFSKALLDTEPNAEDYYLKFGFTVIGRKPTSVKYRYMPIMLRDL